MDFNAFLRVNFSSLRFCFYSGAHLHFKKFVCAVSPTFAIFSEMIKLKIYESHVASLCSDVTQVENRYLYIRCCIERVKKTCMCFFACQFQLQILFNKVNQKIRFPMFCIILMAGSNDFFQLVTRKNSFCINKQLFMLMMMIRLLIY